MRTFSAASAIRLSIFQWNAKTQIALNFSANSAAREMTTNALAALLA